MMHWQLGWVSNRSLSKAHLMSVWRRWWIKDKGRCDHSIHRESRTSNKQIPHPQRLR